MKKVIYSMLFLLSLLSTRSFFAQTINFSVTPQTQCLSTSNTAMVSGFLPGATSYSWAIVPSSPNCNPFFSPIGNGQSGVFHLPCCGVYTITMMGFISGNPIASQSGTIAVTCPNFLSISSSPNGVLCQGQSAVIMASGGISYTWTPGFVNTPTVIVTPTTSTCYTLSATNASGCIQRATTCFSVSPGLPISITASADSVCGGGPVVLTASGASSYTWYPGGQNGAAITVFPNTSTTYTVVGSNGFGCISTAIKHISVLSPPMVNVSGNVFCPGTGSVVLSLSGANSYTWVPGNIVSPTLTVPAVPGMCYTFTARNMVGCSVTTAVCLYANGPTVGINGPNSVCQNGVVTLTGAGATSYTWSTGAVASSITVSLSSTTCYSVVGSNGPGCTGTAVKCVSVVSQPVLTVSGNTTICSGSSTSLVATGAASYTWLPGNLTGPFVVLSPVVSTCYTLVGSNGNNNCLGFKVFCINVSPSAVTASSSAGGFICAGSSATLTANGGSGVYTWQPGNMTGSSIVVSPSVTTCYTVTSTGSVSCNGSAAVCVYVNPRPTIAATNGGFFCAGSTGTLFASGANTYTWQPGNLTGAQVVITPSVGGCYTVTGSNTFGCTNSAVTCFSVMPTSTLFVAGSPTICAGSSTPLFVSGANNYVWQPGNQTGSSIVVSPSVSTCYTVYGYVGNCASIGVKCITVLPSSLTVSGNSSICQGGSATLTASGGSGYVWQPGNIPGASIVVSPSVTTCYTVTTTNSTSCGSAVKCISINPPAYIGVMNSGLGCAGSTATLTAYNGISYTWQPGNLTGSQIVITPSVSGCYTVTGTNASGCTGATVTCFSVTPAPSVTILGPNSICAGSNAVLTASGAASYQWLPSNQTAGSIVVSPSVSTCYTVLGYIGNCFGVAVKCLSVQPSSIIISGNSAICPGSSTSLTASGSVGGYTWQPGNMTGSGIVVSPSVTTCYTVTTTNTIGGCSGTAVKCIVVNPRPVITTSTSGFSCGSPTGTVVAFGANSYTWIPTNLTGSIIVITPSVSPCYTVIGSNTFGCTNFAVGCFSVNPGINITISGPNVVCGGNSATLTASGAASYLWSTGQSAASIVVTPSVSTCYSVTGFAGNCNGVAVKCVSVQTSPVLAIVGTNSSVCAGSTVTLQASGAQTYTWLPGNQTGQTIVITPSASICYTLVGTNSGGCVGLGYFCVQVKPRPTITTGGGFFCGGQSGVLSAQGASTYTWLPFNQTGSSIVITPTASGCYTVIGTNSVGCTNSATNCYSVMPAQSITINGPSSICGGSSAILTASGSVSSYTWLPMGTFGSSVVVSPSVTTCYTVISNAFGCVSSAVKCITVNQGLNITISGNSSICQGAGATFLASGASFYQWSNGSTGPLLTVTPSVSTCYTVTGSNGSGCTGQGVVCVTIKPTPVLSISGNTAICAGASATLCASGAVTYSWSNGGFGSCSVITPSVSGPLFVTGTNTFGCSSTRTINVNVLPRPVVQIVSSHSFICAGQSVNLTAVGAATYTWSTGANGPLITVSPLVSTNYIVNGTGPNGCTSSAGIFVAVHQCTGIDKVNGAESSEIFMYPNPSSDRITLETNATQVNYSIYDAIGRQITKGEFSGTATIHVSELAGGTYIVKFESGSFTTYKRLIVEK